MPGDNIAVIRDVNAAFRRCDWATVAENVDPHILIRTDARWPEQRIYGREAAVAFYRGLCESGGADIRVEEMTDLADRVLVRICWHMQGLRSGLEGEQRTSVICTFRDGRIMLEEFFLEHEHALEALGLAE